MAAKGRTFPFLREGGRVRNRRISPVAAHSGDRLLSEPTAGTQPCRREPLFMPHCRHSLEPVAGVSADGTAPSVPCDVKRGIAEGIGVSVARMRRAHEILLISQGLTDSEPSVSPEGMN